MRNARLGTFIRFLALLALVPAVTAEAAEAKPPQLTLVPEQELAEVVAALEDVTELLGEAHLLVTGAAGDLRRGQKAGPALSAIETAAFRSDVLSENLSLHVNGGGLALPALAACEARAGGMPGEADVLSLALERQRAGLLIEAAIAFDLEPAWQEVHELVDGMGEVQALRGRRAEARRLLAKARGRVVMAMDAWRSGVLERLERAVGRAAVKLAQGGGLEEVCAGASPPSEEPAKLAAAGAAPVSTWRAAAADSAGAGEDDIPSFAASLAGIRAATMPPPELAADLGFTGVITLPVVLHAPKGRYPVGASDYCVYGYAALAAWIGQDGSVDDVWVRKYLPGWTQPTVDRIRGRKYEPATANGKQVGTFFTMTTSPRLRAGCVRETGSPGSPWQ